MSAHCGSIGSVEGAISTTVKDPQCKVGAVVQSQSHRHFGTPERAQAPVSVHLSPVHMPSVGYLAGLMTHMLCPTRRTPLFKLFRAKKAATS
jgi:hypothetical protein